jgi:hypothetical protein
MTTFVSTTLSTRFNHPFYADDVINLSITDLLDTQYTGQLAVSAVPSVNASGEYIPFAFTHDLRLFVVTTPQHAFSDHIITLPRMRFDVTTTQPSATSSQQSLRLSGSWKAVAECEYEEAVKTLAARFPTFDVTVGSFANYQRLPLTIHKLHTEYILLVDEAMFGPERITGEVLRLKQPILSIQGLGAYKELLPVMSA